MQSSNFDLVNLIKYCIYFRPESLIVERVKIAQTVALLSARDPYDLSRIISIRDAIARQIIDTNLKIYRSRDETMDLGDAISKDLIQAETVKEVTEKVTETLTEEKSLDNFGLVKKTETSSTSSLSQRHSVTSEASVYSEEASESVQEIDGVYVMDLAKSVNVSRRIQKNSEEFAAGYVTEANSEKLLSSKSSNGRKTLSPIIDLNEAIRNDIVFLPDSHLKTQNVKYVLDLKTGERLSLDEACSRRIIDVFNRVYIDTRDGSKINLFEALGKFYIVMKEQLYTNYSDAEDHKLGHADILTVFNPKCGEQVNVDKAIALGLYDKELNKYVDLNSGRVMPLEEASEKGMVVLRSSPGQPTDGYQFLYINGVVNPLTKEEMQLSEAIESGILDYVECEVHDPQSGQTLSLLEAYDKGLLVTSTQNRSPIVRKKILKNRTETTVDLAGARITTKTNLLVDTNQMDVIRPRDFKAKRSGLVSSAAAVPLKSDESTGPVSRVCGESGQAALAVSALGGDGQGEKIVGVKSQVQSQSQSPARASKRGRSFDFSLPGSRGRRKLNGLF